MRGLLRAIQDIIGIMNVIAGIALTFIIALTLADVILRAFGRPILGTYEIVGMAGGVVIGFVTPFTSWVNGHISMDFLTGRLPAAAKKGFQVATRCVGIGLFIMISWNVLKIAGNLRSVNEVSATLEIPIYPIAYGVAFSFFMLSVVLFCDILKIAEGTYGGGGHE